MILVDELYGHDLVALLGLRDLVQPQLAGHAACTRSVPCSHPEPRECVRAVDASIMPDCVRANTNVTTMMIGERIAEFIREGK